MVAPGLGPPTGNPLMDALSPLPAPSRGLPQGMGMNSTGSRQAVYGGTGSCMAVPGIGYGRERKAGPLYTLPPLRCTHLRGTLYPNPVVLPDSGILLGVPGCGRGRGYIVYRATTLSYPIYPTLPCRGIPYTVLRSPKGYGGSWGIW